MKSASVARGRAAPVAVIAVAGCVAMVLSEIVERISGGFTPISYTVTVGGFLGLAVAAVAAHVGQRPPDGALGLAGAVAFAAGASVQALADIVGFGLPDEAALQAATGPLVPIGGVLLVVGGLALGVAILRARRYPAWTGVLIATMPLFLPATLLGLPVPVISLTNSILALALGVVAWQFPRSTAS